MLFGHHCLSVANKIIRIEKYSDYLNSFALLKCQQGGSICRKKIGAQMGPYFYKFNK